MYLFLIARRDVLGQEVSYEERFYGGRELKQREGGS